MKLQQLRYLIAIEKNNLSISGAAEKMCTSQPGVSKQIRQLEDELGIKLFNRNGKQLTHITVEGNHIIERAKAIMREVDNIKGLASEFRDNQIGTLKLATTHTQARYLLPPVIRQFRQRYPQVNLQIQQGRPEEIASMAASGEVDFAIATEAIGERDDLIMLPCYHWNRCVLVRKEHPLASSELTSLAQIAEYPIVTYVFGFTGRSQFDDSFTEAGQRPNIVLTAVDSDVIKTYVRLELGIGIVARMAHNEVEDADLVALDAGHLFPDSSTKIGFRRGKFLRGYVYQFMELFAPHLTLQKVDAAAGTRNREDVESIFSDVRLPVY